MRVIVAFIALAVLAAMAVPAFETALEASGQDIRVENETFTPSAGSITTLDDSDRTGAYYDPNVTVYDDTDTEVDPGEDYVWFEGNGTIKTVTGGELDGDTSAKITYSYQLTSQEEREWAQTLSFLPQTMGFLLPVGAIVLLFVFLRGLTP